MTQSSGSHEPKFITSNQSPKTFPHLGSTQQSYVTQGWVCKVELED
jgi:hypothetical protein